MMCEEQTLSSCAGMVHVGWGGACCVSVLGYAAMENSSLRVNFQTDL